MDQISKTIQYVKKILIHTIFRILFKINIKIVFVEVVIYQNVLSKHKKENSDWFDWENVEISHYENNKTKILHGDALHQKGKRMIY